MLGKTNLSVTNRYFWEVRTGGHTPSRNGLQLTEYGKVPLPVADQYQQRQQRVESIPFHPKPRPSVIHPVYT